jgi:hypothetical protein
VLSVTRSLRWSTSRPDLVLDAAHGGLGQGGFADRGARDGQRVDRIGLGERPRALALHGHQLGRNAQDALAGAQQVTLQGTAEIAGVLDRPDAIVVKFARPVQQVLVAMLSSLDGELLEQLGGLAVDRRGGVGGLVGIHPDDHHLLQPLSCR